MSEIPKKQEGNKIIINDINCNKEQIYKLDFNFDLLNEPLPDFLNQNKNNNFFLNKKNFVYKRKYNEIKKEGEYLFPKGPTLKLNND